MSPYGMEPYGVPPRGPWVVPAGPGRPFHQLARTPLHRWWRPLLGTVVGVAGTLGLMIVVYLIAMLVALAIGEDPSENARHGKVFDDQTASLALELLSLAVLTPVVLVLAWAVQRRPWGSVTSVTGRLRGRWLLVCSGAAVAASAASFGVSVITGLVVGEGDPWAGMSWSRLFPVILVIVALVPFQAAAEEYVFRGWLLQAVGSWTLEAWTGRSAGVARRIFGSPWPGIVVSTAAFTAGHAHRGWALVDIALFGLTAAWIAVRTGGLEAGIALHTVNNLVAFGFSAAEGTVDKAAAVTDAPWYSLIGSAVQLTVFVVVVTFAARRLGIATRSSARTGGPGVPAVPAGTVPGLAPAPVMPGPPAYGPGPYAPPGHGAGPYAPPGQGAGPYASPGYGAGPYGPPGHGAGPYDGRAVPGPTPPGTPQAPW